MAPLPNTCLVGDFDCFMGVEFEFITAGMKNGRPPSLKRTILLVLGIEHQQSMRLEEMEFVLREGKIRTWPISEQEEIGHMTGPEQYEDWISQKAREQGFELQVPGPRVEHQFWNPHRDSSVTPDKFQTVVSATRESPACGIEVSTRVLRASEAADEIRRGLALIRSEMNTVRAGLHVHVSEPPRPGWPGGTVSSLTIRKMLSLLMMVEGTLFKLCDPWRLGHDYCIPVTDTIYNESKRSRFDKMPRLSKLGRKYISSSIKNIHDKSLFVLIWHEHLFNFNYGNHGTSAVRISDVGNADKRLADDTVSIEFRYLEGTLDPVLTCQWARICCALLRTATLPKAAFRLKMLELDEIIQPGVMATHTKSKIPLTTATIRDFLKAIGLYDARTYLFWIEKVIKNCKTALDRPVATDFLPPLSP